jgi:hypothetical protein
MNALKPPAKYGKDREMDMTDGLGQRDALGLHHIGLTVHDVERSARSCLSRPSAEEPFGRRCDAKHRTQD